MMAPLAKVFGGIGAVLVTLMVIGFALPWNMVRGGVGSNRGCTDRGFSVPQRLEPMGCVDQLGRTGVGVE